MPDRSRWRAPQRVRTFISTELDTTRHTTDPWPALERAHIAAQPWARDHTIAHLRMLRYAIRQRDRHEIGGQLLRILVAAPGSLTGRYPPGNTGRATTPLTATADVPAEIAELLAQ